MNNEKIFKKTILYIVRINNRGEYRNSAPCVDCFDLILSLNIKKIVFSTNDDFKIYKPTEFETDHISSGNRYR